MAEKKKLKKPRWIDEFKNFAIKGNALSMAVGVIIGGGFSTITKSLTDDVIMPIVSMFLGGVNFSQWYLTLPQWFGQKLDAAGDYPPVSGGGSAPVSPRRPPPHLAPL